MPFVYVARHGETDWNAEGRYQGQLESQLTPLGRRQAGALTAALAASGAKRVVASPLARCVETARPLALALGIGVQTDPLLLEIGHGTWEGRLRGDLERDDPVRMAAWIRNPASVRFVGGESLADVAARWRTFTESSIGKNEDAVVVTHDVLVRIAVLLATERDLDRLWEPRVQNAGYARFEVTPAGWRLLDECHDGHLAGMLADTSRQAL